MSPPLRQARASHHLETVSSLSDRTSSSTKTRSPPLDKASSPPIQELGILYQTGTYVSPSNSASPSLGTMTAPSESLSLAQRLSSKNLGFQQLKDYVYSSLCLSLSQSQVVKAKP